jgi:metallo-beta-lactamase family protein
MARLHFLGAAREVTGSMHLLETDAGRLLIDCGFYQGRREESRARNLELPDEALSADAVILTHAHIDHSGSLPTLVRDGFRGKIFTTTATRDLCGYMLRDSARIQEGDARFLNRKNGHDPDWTPIEPIYTEEDAVRALSRFVGVAYGARFEPLPGVHAQLIEAGHILGSAQVVIDLSASGTPRRLVFSGDLGRPGMPILRDPAVPERPDYLVMESTYGGRAHGTLEEMDEQLRAVVVATAEKRGKLIIPAFSVGRTQEIVYALHRLHAAKRIPELPMFVDSPLSVHVTEVFRAHPECFDEETRAFVERSGDPFCFSSLRYVESVDESMRLNDLHEPAIIIAASGMCESGRVLHHLRNAVEDERNTICIVGFQALHTLGRRLVERRPRVRILGVERELHARVVVMNGFSAHADRGDLHRYVEQARPSVRRVFLVHGEPEAQAPLSEWIGQQGLAVAAPAPRDTAELD